MLYLLFPLLMSWFIAIRVGQIAGYCNSDVTTCSFLMQLLASQWFWAYSLAATVFSKLVPLLFCVDLVMEGIVNEGLPYFNNSGWLHSFGGSKPKLLDCSLGFCGFTDSELLLLEGFSSSGFSCSDVEECGY
jgi:hypothetical protein